MKEDIKILWVDALRSGEFKQIRGQLSGNVTNFKHPKTKIDKNNPDEIGYCCLGVLTKLYCRAHKKGFGTVAAKGGHEFLSPCVRAWSGIKSDNELCSHTYKQEKTNLANLNDNDEKSFKQIAKRIEKLWEQL